MKLKRAMTMLAGAALVLLSSAWAAGSLSSLPAASLLSVKTSPADMVKLLSANLDAGSSVLPVSRVVQTGRLAKLGPDFLWGVASSGFQVEGYAPDSNWTRYIAAKPMLLEANGTSVDFLHRYEADIDRAVALGVKAYRISIEWARLEPRPGVIDSAGWAFYDGVIGHMVKRGIRPMLTIDHWVYPAWMLERGGWASSDMQANWLTHAKRVVDRYSGYNPIWITINEPTFYLFSEVVNGGLKLADIRTMNDGLVSVHRAIYDYIHARQPGALVSSNVAYQNGGIEGRLDAMVFDRIIDKIDFIGLDFYGSPDGMYYMMRYYAERYPKLPLYVIENGKSIFSIGTAQADGRQRGDYLRDTVYWLQRAKADGIQLLGYNHWSLTDTYEWGTYKMRFGLYTVNVKTDPSLTRIPTSGVPAYAEVSANQGVPSDYKPTVDPQPCSLVAPPDSCTRPVRVK